MILADYYLMAALHTSIYSGMTRYISRRFRDKLNGRVSNLESNLGY